MSTPNRTDDQFLRIAPSVARTSSAARPVSARRQNLVTWADKAVMQGLSWCDRQLDGTDFHGANLRDATFTGCSLTACDFSSADLRGARFIDCDLRRANLDQAWLSDTAFSGSWLTGVQGLSALQRTTVRRAGGQFLVLVQTHEGSLSEPKAA